MSPENLAILEPFGVVAKAAAAGRMLHIMPEFLGEIMERVRRDALELRGAVVPINLEGKLVGYMLREDAKALTTGGAPFSIGYTVQEPPK